MRESDRQVALDTLHLCVKDIMNWNIHNMLKFNPTKTDIVHITSRFQATTLILSFAVGGHLQPVTKEAKDLGVIIDSNLTMKSHINNVCRTASLSLRNIGKRRRYLGQDDTERIVHAFVTTRLDYCNSIIFGTSKHNLSKLQRLQNSAARLVTRTKIRAHITPVLKDLHWLQIERLVFKILLIVF